MLETIFLSVSLWPDPSELCYIIPFWHLLSNFNEMTQANKLSLNFPSLCPLVSSFINWTANVVLILSFLQLNLEWPSLLVVYGPELLSLTFPSAAWHPFCFSFFPVEMNEQDIRYRDTLGHGNGGTVYKWVVILFQLSVHFAKCWEPGTLWQRLYMSTTAWISFPHLTPGSARQLLFSRELPENAFILPF